MLRVVWVTLLLLGLGTIFVLLRGVLTPVFFALLLAYALDPLVDRFEAARLPRSVGIAILLFLALSLLALFALLVLPAIVRDIGELYTTLYQALTQLLVRAIPWLRAHGIRVPADPERALEALGARAFGLSPSTWAPVGDAIGAALGGTASVLGSLARFIMVPVFSFYFLHDFDRMVVRVRELLPAAARPVVVSMAIEVDGVLGQFVHGQLTVMAILATLYAVGYSVVQVPLAVPIGVLAGLLSFIPYVGSGLALVLGLLMVLLHFSGMGQVLGVVGVYALVQTLEGFVITPRIVGGKLGLSPVWVLFALLAFGELFGFVGVMLALPASAVIKVFVTHGLARYRDSALFLGASPATAVAVAARRPGRLRLRTHQRRARLRSSRTGAEVAHE
jgi:predicted PurR-regulated permease PerM